jgi:hypothetical protein
MITSATSLQSATGPLSPLLRVSTRYMETLRQVQPVLGGNDITAFLNTNRLIDLYTSGTAGLVFRLSPQQDSYAPYAVESLGFQASSLQLFLPLTGSADRPAILGLNSNRQLTLSTWQTGGGYRQQLFEPAKEQGRKLKSIAALRGATGNIYVTAILDDDSLVNNFFSPADLQWASERWVPIKGPDNAASMVQELAMVSNDPVQNRFFAIGTANSYAGKVLFAADNFAFSQLTDLGAPVISGKWGKVGHISVVTDSQGLLRVFAVEQSTGGLWQKVQKKYLVDNKIVFGDWQLLSSPDGLFNPFGTTFRQVRAMVRYDNLIELYCIDADGGLFYTRQLTDSKGADTGFTSLFPLNREVNTTNFTVTRNALGYSVVYSLTSNNELMQFLQSPESTQWFSARLFVQDTGQQVISVPTHSVDITVLDEKGIPQPKAEVSLSASFLTRIAVNGLSYPVSAADTVRLSTDATGRLSLLQDASGLAGATLYVETPFTGTGEPVVVEPNLQLQGKMNQTTASQVMEARDKAGNYLLNGAYRTQENANAIASVMQSAMQLCNTEEQSPVVYFYRHRGLPHLRRQALRTAATGGESWEISFGGNNVGYQKLDSAAVDLYRSRMAAAGIFGIDWSDVWDAIKGGFKKVVDGIKKIVVTVADKIKVLFEIVVDGITRVFEAVMETVQQVFDFVEGVWSWVKATAQQLYEWLAFFFSWDDIKRTAGAVEYSTNVFLDFTTAAVNEISAGAEKWIDSLKEKLQASVDDYLARYGGNETLGTIGKDYQKPNPEAENALDHNILFSAYKENYQSTAVQQAFALRVQQDSRLAELLDKLQTLSDDFTNGDGKQAFEEAISYFSNIKDNPDKALELLFSGLVKVGESIALFALDLGKALIVLFLQIIAEIIGVFKDLMNEEWEIPIVSSIYEYITGSTLSFKPITLLSYIIAIPATLIYKLSTGEAPFADDKALQDFKDYFTLDWLKKRAGIGTSRTRSLVRDATQESVARTLFKAGYAVAMFVGSFADITTAAASSVETKAGPVGYVSTAAGILAAVFTNPWIVDIDPGKLVCSNNGTKNGSGGSSFKLGYIASVLGPLKSATLLIANKIMKWPDPVAIRVNEISSSVVGAAQCIIYVVEFVTAEDADPKVFARTLSASIPGKMLRFLSLSELNAGAYYIPVAILGVLIFSGYTAAFIINFTIDTSGKIIPVPAEKLIVT